MDTISSDALGMIETKGFVGMVEASDAMVKAARVELVGVEALTVAARAGAVHGLVGLVAEGTERRGRAARAAALPVEGDGGRGEAAAGADREAHSTPPNCVRVAN
jgi:ethanolamine utilization protein EutM